MNYIYDIKNKIAKEVFRNIYATVCYQSQNIYLHFPARIDNPKQSYIGSSFEINEQKYYVGDYIRNHTSCFEDIWEVPVEIFQGSIQKRYTYTCMNETIIPIMVREKNEKVEIIYNQELHTLTELKPECFYYYKFPKGSSVDIQSKTDLVLGKPINQAIDAEKPKLILNIFVDGLSQYFLNQEGLENVMPNTAEFFRKGSICTEAYSVGEWTYVSVANYFTGKYTMNHRQFHPEFNSKVLHHQPIFSETFQKEGYFTTKIDGNWRCCPLYGYAKGFDRTLYRHGYYGMDTREVISETLEHLYAFPAQNHFMWICLFDLHDIAEEWKTSIGTQTHLEAKDNIIHSTEQKSVYKEYDRYKVKQYGSQLRKIDMYLYSLYKYIEQNFHDNEIVISLISDHGQSFLKDTENYLDVHRTHIPMMFRGKNIPVGICDEIVQSTDLFPIISHCLGMKGTFKHDGNVAKYFGGQKDREYALAETLFPNKPYQIIFFESDIKIRFKSVENCTADGRIPDKGFSVCVFDISTDEDITSKFPDKVSFYENIMYEHIKEYLI